MSWDAIVLAAGDGTRMLSKLPKVLHKVAGQPMIERTIEALNEAGATNIHVVVSQKILNDLLYIKTIFKNVFFHIQNQPLGTADAVYSVKASLSEYVLICNGDHPLVNAKDILHFIDQAQLSNSDLNLALLELSDPSSFGRVIQSKNSKVDEIIEAKHCSPEQLKICIVNSGIYYSRSDLLFEFLKATLVSRDVEAEFKTASKKEYYLTDIVKFLNSKGYNVSGFTTSDDMGFGVNDSLALAQANQKAYLKINQRLMQNGVKLISPETTYIEGSVQIDADVLIYPNVFIFGASKVEVGSIIESGSHIKNSKLGPHTLIKAGSYLEGAKVLGHSSIGPYAHLREGAVIHPNVKVGNFAEVKNSILFKGVKAGHQCYLGDAEIGENTNIGAGTITCNFAADGKKYQTKIGKNVFIGSDTQIVPPIVIEDDSVIAAGATVTKNVEAKSLYVTRAKAFVKQNYRK